MNVGEHWSTLVSMILGLAVAELLVNLHRLIHERKRVDWDALPLAWALVVLLFVFNTWWAVATNADGASGVRVVAQLVPRAIVPVLVFLLAASVLPRRVSEQGRIAMRAEWAESRRVFYTVFVLNQCMTWALVFAVRGSVLWDSGDIARTGALAVLLLALFSKARSVEWIAVAIALALVTMRLFVQPTG